MQTPLDTIGKQSYIRLGLIFMAWDEAFVESPLPQESTGCFESLIFLTKSLPHFTKNEPHLTKLLSAFVRVSKVCENERTITYENPFNDLDQRLCDLRF